MLARATHQERCALEVCAEGATPVIRWTPSTSASPRTQGGDLVDPVDWPRPKNPRLAALEEQVRRICGGGRASGLRCSSGLAELDAALGGGFVRGAVHELVALQAGAAACSLALWVAAGAVGPGQWLVYIDTTLDFYPPAAAQLGVPLERLVVIRTASRADALWAGEQALRCGGVGAVVMPLPALDARASRRLQLAAEAGQGLALLICRTEACGPTFAASRLRLDPLCGEVGNDDGGLRSAHGRRLRVAVLRLRTGWVGEPFVLALPELAAGRRRWQRFRVPAGPPAVAASGVQKSVDSWWSLTSAV